ncbi:NACHT domain-containing protein [Streptomyces sp. NPDC047928]|uniref:NACHT domain-containing protein n=1 Tax=unclassified Streptomyces TaxID=2593676 RepID=UPI0037178858
MSPRGAVAVLGERQGSGVLLSTDTVLTCAHVVGDGPVAVALPGRPHPLPGRVVWSDRRLDAALLKLLDHVVDERYVPDLRELDTEHPVRGCEILGFPRIQRYDDGRRLDLDQFSGTVLPLAGLVRNRLVFEFDRPPATEPTGGPSPLAGLSGAPVLAGASLVGIVREIPPGRGHRRAHCVPLPSVTADNRFLEVFMSTAGVFLTAHLPPLTGPHVEDRAYAEEYAEALGAAYRRTRIFGLDELGKRASEWDLDTAYLSLEAASREPAATAPAPQRVEDLLASRPRVLLRGDAGAGKTTLLWWLAAHAAAGTLGPELAELNGRVPFVVPLRTLRARGDALPTPEELPRAARLMVDTAPDGWAGRVLKDGRALLLVDGLDEVPREEREATHAWLSGLLARFPGTRCVATVRPLAVEPAWLASAGFDELTLLPMRDTDIQAFVSAWHRAARLDADPHEDLDDLERGLAQQFARNPALSDLARTPLLCAVICALHRLRQGFLPDTRWALYESALQMLLGTRDSRRSVDAPEGITMNVEEHQQLLQRIAAWLVRGGQTEFTRDQALHQLARALPGMPRVRDQGGPEAVLNHLLNRSGLLQERSADTFQFAHRTFQDFLAAKEFVDDDNLKEMLQHAHDQQWHDVLLLAAGHCSRRRLPMLVNGLLQAGDAAKGDRRTSLYVLAALCAQHAAWLDEHTDERTRAAVRGVLPPANATRLRELARLGPYVLPLLPEPGERPALADDATFQLLNEIGGREAIPYARRFVADGRRPSPWLASRWSAYPAEEYAREVLGRVDLTAVLVVVSTREQLAQLPRLRRAGHVVIMGDFTGDELGAALAGHEATHLDISNNHVLTDLGFLSGSGRLESLSLALCPAAAAGTLPRGLPGLRTVSLSRVRVGTADLEALAGLPRLRALELNGTITGESESESGSGSGRRLDLRPLRDVPGLSIGLSSSVKRQVIGHELFGDRLTVTTWEG